MFIKDLNDWTNNTNKYSGILKLKPIESYELKRYIFWDLLCLFLLEIYHEIFFNEV